MPNRLASIAIFAALTATAAAAQQPAPAPAPSTEVSPLTVEGAAKPKTIEKQARRFVESYAADANVNIGQIGRWGLEDPICVQVNGIAPDQAAAIKARIEDVAQAVGLPKPWGGAACKADVRIVFVDPPQPLAHPVMPRYETTEANIAGGLCGIVSRIKVCTVSRFTGLLLAVDVKTLGGRSTGVLADYLAMVTLSKPASMDGCNSFASVIDAYAKAPCPGREAPDGLTPADAAFLTALYKVDLSRAMNFEQSDIASAMADILIKARTEGAPAK
jgi:hypothetical protein